ncbi:hypothetical protein DPMN_109432 [Dreissena polymorpha]|uniref:Uncharacterized protein n=1 Tax=Dreissena polymorpha TaxID=45954 RepID=A0A9D4KAA2_DREPO|nr:hypothetical protein DPMN_109432 [Dreissena polymorpha]
MVKAIKKCQQNSILDISHEDRMTVNIAYALACTSMISILPMTFFKALTPDTYLSKLELIYTFLRLLPHLNFASKIVLYCCVCTKFRTYVCTMLCRGVHINMSMKKLWVWRPSRRTTLPQLRIDRISVGSEEDDNFSPATVISDVDI